MRKGGGGGETQRAVGPSLAGARRGWRKALAHIAGSFAGQAWPPEPNSGPGRVLACRGASGICHLWASVSSPLSQETVGSSVVFKLKKKKKNGSGISSNQILLKVGSQEGHNRHTWAEERGGYRMLPTPQPLALQSSPRVKTTRLLGSEVLQQKS